MKNKWFIKKIYIKKYITLLLSFILFISGVLFFQPRFNGRNDETIYIYGVIYIESAVLAKINYTNLHKKSFIGSMNFTNLESMRTFLGIEENSIVLDKDNIECTNIKIKNKRKFLKIFSDFYIKEFSKATYFERFSVIKIPLKFISFEKNDKDYWELDYRNAEFIDGPSTKEDCEKSINSKIYI